MGSGVSKNSAGNKSASVPRHEPASPIDPDLETPSAQRPVRRGSVGGRRGSIQALQEMLEKPKPSVLTTRKDNRSSCRVVFNANDGRSFFQGIEQGAFHASSSDLSDDPPENDEFAYEDGFKVSHRGETVGSIIKRLGQGAMGTVYSLRLSDGSVVAAKAVREDVGASERLSLEKQLATEVAICFAMGRSPLTASVIRMIIVLPGVETTAKGLLLLCDLVDKGDLEEAFHSGKLHDDELVQDYSGALYTEGGAAIWPLGSLTLQIFLAFDHMHRRGIIHQVTSMLLARTVLRENSHCCSFLMTGLQT